MQIIVNEIFNHPYLTSGKDRVDKHIITADTFEECCLKIYKLERSARYNNFLHYVFIDSNIKKAYQEWKKNGVTVELFYNNATVD